jgi:citrate synthase
MSTGAAPPTPRGLDGVVAARTRLSHVDGQNGVLVIGGYELKELAGQVTFEEVAALLWRGRLPGRAELGELTRESAALRALPEATLRVVREAAQKKAPPIDALRMACATLSLDVRDPNDISPGADVGLAKMLVARFPTIVAAHTRLVNGEEPIAPALPP